MIINHAISFRPLRCVKKWLHFLATLSIVGRYYDASRGGFIHLADLHSKNVKEVVAR